MKNGPWFNKYLERKNSVDAIFFFKRLTTQMIPREFAFDDSSY